MTKSTYGRGRGQVRGIIIYLFSRFCRGSGKLARVTHLFPLRSYAPVLFQFFDYESTIGPVVYSASPKQPPKVFFVSDVQSHLCERLKSNSRKGGAPPIVACISYTW